MKLAIELSDDLYNKLKMNPRCDSCAGPKLCDLIDVILDGISLEGYGDLIDREAFRQAMWDQGWFSDDMWNDTNAIEESLDEMPAVVKATQKAV